MKYGLRGASLMAALALLAACGGDEAAPNAAVEQDTAAPAGGEGTPGMQGMAGMHDDAMMQQMGAHMQSMAGMRPDSMRAMMPRHRQMTANMLAQMNRDMQQMNMPGDATWTATVDSLRKDLVRLPEMSAQELEAFMPAHRARMTRLMDMHRSMMGNMPM